MIPLDDLLPQGDEHNIEPDCGVFFDVGKPCWEMADIYKWHSRVRAEPECCWNSFELGFYAGVFELLLKTGKQFLFDSPSAEAMELFKQRAKDFRRSVTSAGDRRFIVSPYEDEA